ncbi:mechanosensitive ion channel family protein [Parahaliea mediterranea]|uniref:mechanosensitive ion channel family protein n=1 Tax=Parahaliea mediterranea TaxID=651086 RepID=UPI000E2EBAEB|nr:mechanosensitive ion channel family protein [Parahaliea mediterranea]
MSQGNTTVNRRWLCACRVPLLALLLLLAGGPLFAAEPGTQSEGTGANSESVSRLIEVLEDPQQREEFLNHLQALESVDSADANDPAVLSDTLRLEERVGLLLENYIGTLENIGLDRGALGRVATLTGALLVIAIGVLLNNWLARVLNRRLGRWRERFHLDTERFASLFALQVWGGLAFAALLLVYTLTQVYTQQLAPMLPESLLLGIAETVLAVYLVVLLFMLIWELSNAIMEYVSGRENSMNTARAQTLLPMMRNVLLFILLILAAMVVLSELGIDVMPLLAGAGVLGIAVGFGAQTLVKDFLTGFTIIAEDLVHVGDVVTVGGRTGEVTRLTIRKMELRSLEGTVHTVPFSEISVVDNLTKDFSYYMFNVGVAYREDIDAVIQCLREVDEDMRADDEFSSQILGPLEVLGVDEFADSAVVIKARTRTAARSKWRVGREFNRRMKYAFDERNIEIPFPHQTLFFGETREGEPQPAARELFAAASPETSPRTPRSA